MEQKRLLQKVRFALLTLLAAAYMLPLSVHGQSTLTVTNFNDSGANSLRDQIAAASSGDTVEITVSGTITLTSGRIAINDKDLIIRGSGADLIAISGDLNSRIFRIEGSSNIVIEDLSLIDGRPNNGLDGSDGVLGTSATRDGEDGGTASSGGAIAVFGSNASLGIENVVIENCRSGKGGNGGDGIQPVDNNEGRGGHGGQGGNGGRGGAILCEGALTAVNCLFIDNRSGNGGDGGFGAKGSKSTSSGTNGGDGGDGGNGGNGGPGAAIAFEGTDLSLVNCQFIDNKAGVGGDGSNAGNGKDGTAGPGGGDGGDGGDGGHGGNGGLGAALWLNPVSGTQKIYNCLFTENNTGIGGDGGARGDKGLRGGSSDDDGVNGNNGTVGDETAYLLDLETDVSCDFRNNIVWGNTSDDGNVLTDNIELGFSGLTVQYSIVQNDEADLGSPIGVIGDDPVLDDPDFRDVASGNFDLEFCSPAFNAGDPATGEAELGATDFFGNPRVYNTVDMGPVEIQSPSINSVSNATNMGILINWDYPLDLQSNLTSYSVFRNGESSTAIAVPPLPADGFTSQGDPGYFQLYCVEVIDGSGCASNPSCGLGRQETDGSISGKVASPGNVGVPGVELSVYPPVDGVEKEASFDFNGLDQYVVLPEASEGFTDMTLEAWVWIAAVDSSDFMIITEQVKTSYLAITSSGKLRFRHGDGDTYVTNSLGNNTVPIQQWVHLAVTFKDLGATAELKTYINGELDRSTTKDATINMGSDSRNRNIGVINSLSSNFFNGHIDELRIWDVVKSEEELDAEKDLILQGNETGLVHYYRMQSDKEDGVLYALDYKVGSQRHGVATSISMETDLEPPVKFTALTDEDGEYSVDYLYYLPSGSAYGVVPSLQDHGFDPDSASVTLTSGSNTADQNFTDTTVFSVQGQVVDLENCPVEGVDVLVTDGLATTELTTTDDAGNWSVVVQNPTTYTISVSNFEGHDFNPISKSVFILDDTSGVNFTDTTTRILHLAVIGGCANEIANTVDVTVRNPGSSPGDCFNEKFTVTGNDTISVRIPAQEYEVFINDATDFSPANTNAYDQFNSLGAFNVDLSEESDTVLFIFHPAPTITVDVPWTEVDIENSCGATPFENVALVEQVVAQLVVLEIEEVFDTDTYDFLTSEIRCPVNPVSSATVTVEDPASRISGLTLPIPENGIVVYQMIPLDISLVNGLSFQPNYTQLLEFVAEVDGQTSTDSRWVLVEGYKQDNATFTTTSPELPYLVLRDPPGDQSYSFFENENQECTEISFSVEEEEGTNNFGRLKVGAAISVGSSLFGAEVSYDFAVWGATEVSTTSGARNLTGEVLQHCVQTGFKLETDEAGPFPGDQSTVVYAAAHNVLYAAADEVIYDEDSCGAYKDRTLVVAPDSIATEFFYTTYQIENDVIPSLELLRDNEPLELDSVTNEAVLNQTALRYANQVNVWEQVLNRIDSLAEVALNGTVTNISYGAGGAGIEVSVTDVESFSTFVEYDMYFDNTVMNDAGLEGAGKGVYGGYGVRMGSTTSHDTVITTSTTTSTGYFLQDGDFTDNWTMNVGTDPIYGTPVFEVIAGETSCPTEPGTSAIDAAQFNINSTFESVSGPTAFFTVTITNISTVPLSSRAYYVGLLNSSNPDGASVIISGVNIGGSPLLVDVLNGQTVPLTLAIDRSFTPSYYFEDLELVLFPACDIDNWINQNPYEELGSVQFSVEFDAPCNATTLFAPEDNWFVNAMSDDDLLVTITDYDPASIVDVVFQYRIPGITDWADFHVVTAGTLSGAGSFYDYPWDISLLPDGNYEIRVRTNCNSGGFTYAPVISGSINRTASQLLSTNAADGGTLGFGEFPAVTINRDIFCGWVDSISVAASFTDDGSAISTLGPICGGSTLTLPFDFAATSECALENQWVNFEVSGIIDQFGNAIDTVQWSFYVDRYEDPTLSFLSSDPTTTAGTDGAIELTISGGAMPYAITWETDAGDTLFGGPLVDSIDFQAFLPAGVYHVTVQDANCSVVQDSVVLSDPSACSIAAAPQNPVTTLLGGAAVLQWDTVSQSVACQVRGERIAPAGPTGFQPIIGFEPTQTNVPYSVLGAGTTWIWQVRCACSISPVAATPLSVTDTIVVPMSRMAQVDSKLQLHPNPTSSGIQLRLIDFEEGEVEILITDMAGRVAHSEKQMVDAADTQVEISETAKLPVGFYRMVVKGSAVVSEPFMKID